MGKEEPQRLQLLRSLPCEGLQASPGPHLRSGEAEARVVTSECFGMLLEGRMMLFVGSCGMFDVL